MGTSRLIRKFSPLKLKTPPVSGVLPIEPRSLPSTFVLLRQEVGAVGRGPCLRRSKTVGETRVDTFGKETVESLGSLFRRKRFFSLGSFETTPTSSDSGRPQSLVPFGNRKEDSLYNLRKSRAPFRP